MIEFVWIGDPKGIREDNIVDSANSTENDDIFVAV